MIMKKIIPGFSSSGGVFSVCRFCHSAFQSFKSVCGSIRVERGHTCVYTKLTFRLHHTQHSCFIFTALWCGCSFVNLPSIFTTPPSWLWLVGTTVQTMPGLHHITDTRLICKYPDCTISKVLTVLKWRMITTFNRKLLEKQSVKNHFASYEVNIGHFFYNVNATVSFGTH